MAYVKSATFGDEISNRDITKSFQKRFKEIGETGHIPVDSSLIPMFETTEKVSLTGPEREDIKDTAEKQCGSSNDMRCIDSTIAKLENSALEEKRRLGQSSASAIKGRRLTVKIGEEDGTERTYVVPDGQEFKLKELGEGVKIKASEDDPGYEFPTLGDTAMQALKIVGTIIATFGYVFSVVATYRTLIQAGYKYLGYAATAAAVFFPYSGFFIMLAFFAVTTYMKKPAQ
jgi:hypothetical protein